MKLLNMFDKGRQISRRGFALVYAKYNEKRSVQALFYTIID